LLFEACAYVLSEQEKNRIEHYLPLHPSVIGAINDVLMHDVDEKDDAQLFFMFNSFQNWIERNTTSILLLKTSTIPIYNTGETSNLEIELFQLAV
jgi:hypothetical protein